MRNDIIEQLRNHDITASIYLEAGNQPKADDSNLGDLLTKHLQARKRAAIEYVQSIEGSSEARIAKDIFMRCNMEIMTLLNIIP